jgi:hypothetical protein
MPLLGSNSNTVRVQVDSSASTGGIDKTVTSLRTLRNQTDSVTKSAQGTSAAVDHSNSRILTLGTVAAGAGIATRTLTDFMGGTIDSANRLQASLTGLNSVATAFGNDAGKAKKAAQELAKDGLMTVADAATGLKNLLAAGFDLDQANELMLRFKNSAAFGRQSALSFGQAVSSATEGIKNGNSILVDNAGVTKNLSNMLVDAGYSAQDLSKASQDAGVRQALFNGIIKETNAQMGDADKLINSTAGKQAMMAAQTEILKQKIGESLQPALLKLLETVTPIVTTIADWISKNPEMAAGIIITTTAVLGLISIINALAVAIPLISAAFTAMKVASVASIGGVGTAFTVMSALVTSPIVMPAIAVAAAIAALALVYDAAMKARSAVEGAMNASKQQDSVNADLRSAAERGLASGRIDKKEYNRLIALSNTKVAGPSAFDRFMTGFADGGYTGRGAPGKVAGVVHAGEFVIPQSGVDQSTGLPKGGGNSIVIQNLNINTPAAVKEFFNISDQDAQNRVMRLSPARGGN